MLKAEIAKVLLLALVVTFLGCSANTPKDISGFYKIDKHVAKDTSLTGLLKIDSTHTWSIDLMSESTFELRKGRFSNVKGQWQIDKVSGDNQFITFDLGGSHTTGRLNGNIIYFETPCLLLDSLFEIALFVKSDR